jgi:membrane protease YdiL (CAAX protease family)
VSETHRAPAVWRDSFWFVLALTIGCGWIGEGSYYLLTLSGLRATLPTLLAEEIPPALGGLIAPYLIIRLIYRKKLKDFGVRWFERGHSALVWLAAASAITIAAWTTLWVGIFGLFVYASHSGIALPITAADFAEKNPLLRLAHHSSASSADRNYVIHVFLTVGFAEELFGRGLLVNALDRRYGQVIGGGRFTIKKSTLYAAFLFAIWHVEWMGGLKMMLITAFSAVTVIIFPSLLLSLVYEKTRSLAVTIALHNVIDGGKLVVWFMITRLFLH